jgi:hypothetical protein
MTPSSSRTTVFSRDAPRASPLDWSASASALKPKVRAGATSLSKLSGVILNDPKRRPMAGCSKSMVAATVRSSAGDAV